MKHLSRIARLLLIPAAVLVTAHHTALAQSTVIPIPFSSIAAGQPLPATPTTCANSLPDIDKLYFGDGCPATQAILNTPDSVAVDSAGNIYIVEYGSTATNEDLRVIYKGGAVLTNMLTVANGNIAGFTPVVGDIYTLAGGLDGTALVQKSGIFFCGNITNGVQGEDSQGDGCPAAQSQIKTRGIAINAYGDIFLSNAGSYDDIRVVYAGDAAVGNLITLENPGVVPTVGYIYRLTNTLSGYAGDGGLASAGTFSQIQGMAVDSKGNIYAADYSPTSTAANYNVRRVDINTGFISTVAGQNVCTTAAGGGPSTSCQFNGQNAYYDAGDGGPATQAGVDPIQIMFDANDNLYILDPVGAKAGGGPRVRVIYNAGTIPGIPGPLTQGFIYTYAGGALTGTSTANGSKAAVVKFGSLSAGGIDQAGNIYIFDSSNHWIWKFDAITGVGNVIAGGPSSTTVAQAGKPCGVGSTFTSVDNYGDGCPALQTYINGLRTLAFDSAGNFYLAASGLPYLQKFSFNNTFPATADGTTVSVPLAFEATATTVLTGESFTLQGKATSEFADAGTDTCGLTGSLSAATLCIFNVAFDPAHPGIRTGSIQLNTAAGLGGAVTETISGTGLGSDIAIDTGTVSMLGTGLVPAGVATDLLGNVYVADKAGNRVLVGPSSGTTLTPLITGLNKPTGVAVDSVGNVYVADSGNNRILETTSAGTTIASLGTGLSSPGGVAVDPYGNIFVADTGNNRIVHLSTNNYQYTVPAAGLATALSAPTELALDAVGDLFILDTGNGRIVEASGMNLISSTENMTTVTIDPGVVPAGVAVDASGTIYVADASSNLQVLAYPPGAITGNVLLTGLAAPVALSADVDANLFVADTTQGAIELRRSLGSFTFPLTNLNTNQTTTVGIDVNNVGNAPLTFTTPLTTVSGANAALYTVAPSTTNGCGAGIPFAAAGSCGFTASFTPVATGMTSATVKFNTNAADTGTVSAILNGNSLRLASTTIAVTYLPSPVNFDSTVTFTAVLKPAVVTTTPTGTLSFQVDNATPVKQTFSATAMLAVPNLVVGPHSVCVTYSGDTVYASSAQCVSFTVNKALTTTTLAQSTVNSAGQITLLLTSTLTSTTANGETGTITFMAGTQVLGVVNLSTATVTTVNGVKTYTVTLGNQALNYTTNSLTAVYSGDANFSGSTSTAVSSTGDFVTVTASNILTVSQGFVGNLNFTVSTLLGSAGTVNVTCVGLPANSLCRELPQSIFLTPAAQTQQTQIQVYSNISTATASNRMPTFTKVSIFTCGLGLGCALLLRRRRRWMVPLAVLLVGLASCLGIGGCTGSSSTAGTFVTPGGTYTISVIFTGANGLTTTHTVPITLVIIPYVPPQ